MKLSLLISAVMFATSVVANGVDTTITDVPTYYEVVSNGMTRFFYDDNYYLTDKYCQFKTTERVGNYDFSKQAFIGEFTDFDNQGRARLRGNYLDGKKNGEFKAYHPNGQLKWEVSYVQDVPHGTWKFYYPDGKPMLELAYDGLSMLIYNYWDNRGRARVERGSGRYELAVNADGYNEFGYVRYIRKGRVAQGRPHGDWTIEYVFDNGKKSNAGHEHYQHGRFIHGYDAFKDEFFEDVPRYNLVPFDVFVRAEYLISKACTIDEYTGFVGYLGEHLEKWFAGAVEKVPEPQNIAFLVTLSKTGEPRKVAAIDSFEDGALASSLLAAFREVRFWFPSYADGTYIDDELIVTAEVFPDVIERKLRFFDVRIKRKQGF